MSEPTTKAVLIPLTVTCVVCGAKKSFKMAGFSPEKLKEYLENWHCTDCRVVSEEELLAMECEGLQ